MKPYEYPELKPICPASPMCNCTGGCEPPTVVSLTLHQLSDQALSAAKSYGCTSPKRLEAYIQGAIAGATADLRAQLAERDAQLAAADKLLQRTIDATRHVARHDNLRRDIHAYQATRQPTQDKGE